MTKRVCLRLCQVMSVWSILAVASIGVAQVTETQSQDGTERREPEQLIRARVDEFVKAYNAHDAKAVTDLFLPQAQIVDEDDNTIQGKDNIQQLFAEVFEQHPQTGIEVNVESIRFIGTHLALETGTTTTRPPEGESPEVGRYSVLHVLTDGQWLMGLVRDVPAAPSHRDHLQALAWLVGDWVDEGRGGTVRTSCRWSDNNSFLLQEITVRQAGKDALKVTQRIGWDPLGKRFKAWVFDSEGGSGESHWTPTESGWLIKATSVSSDGVLASATNHIRPTGLDRYVFESMDRVLGNEVLPPVEVVVVRQPPLPEVSDTKN